MDSTILAQAIVGEKQSITLIKKVIATFAKSVRVKTSKPITSKLEEL